MSQVSNVETSSPKPKRQYRKGNPLSDAEKQRRAVSRKKETHKELNVFIQNSLKARFVALCSEDGTTQAQMIEYLIEQELDRRESA